MKWVKKHAGCKTTSARMSGDGALEAMEDVPGTYVVRRAEV